MSSESPKQYRLLCVDDEAEVIEYYKTIFEEDSLEDEFDMALDFIADLPHDNEHTLQHYFEEEIATQTDYFSQGMKAVEAVEQALDQGEHYAVALVDIRMPPGIDGLETARQIRALDRDILIFIVTAYSDYTVEEIQKVLNHDILVLQKPFYPDDVLQFTSNAIKVWEQSNTLQQLNNRLEQVSPIASELFWEADLQEDTFFPSKHLLQQIGEAHRGKITKFSNFLTYLHPEDRKSTEAILQSGNKQFTLSHRLRTGEEQGYHWFQTRGEISYGPQQTPEVIQGVTLAIEQLPSQEQDADKLLKDYLRSLKDASSTLPSSNILNNDTSFPNLCQEAITAERPFTILLIQLEGVSQARGRVGVHICTQLIQECAKRIEGTVEGEFQLFDYLDELLILYMEGEHSKQCNDALTQTLVDALSFTFSPQMVKAEITPKIECHTYPEDREWIEKLAV